MNDTPSEMLNREQILAAVDLPRESVVVPEWGGTVCLRGLTGQERDEFEAERIKRLPDGKFDSDTRNVRAALVARTLVDAAGNRVFADTDLLALGAKSAAVLDRLFAIASRLSGFAEADVQALEKN